MAFTGITALVGAIGTETAITATMVLSAVAEVGTAMSVVGLVTGDKSLMKIGGIMGMVGGIGSFVSGASSAAGAATNAASDVANTGENVLSSAVDSSPSAAADAAGASSDLTAGMDPTDMRLASGTQFSPGSAGDLGLTTDASGAPLDASTLDPSGQASGAADTTGQAGATTDATTDTTTMGAGTTGATGATGSTTAATTVGDQTAAAQPLAGAPGVQTPAGTVAPVTTPATTVNPVTNGGVANPTDARLSAGTQTSIMPSTAPVDSTTFLQKMMTFAQDPKNKTMLDLGAKVVGGALQGAQSQQQFNQKMALDRQRVQQTSYGTQVGQNRPHGIISGARK